MATASKIVDFIQIDDEADDEQAYSSKATVVRTKKELLDREADDDDMDVSLPPPEWFDENDGCTSPQHGQNALILYTKTQALVQRKRRKEGTDENVELAQSLKEGKPKAKRRKKLVTKKKKAVKAQQKVAVGEERKATGDVSEGEDLDTALPVEHEHIAGRVHVADQTQNGDEGGSDNDLVFLFEKSSTAVASVNKLNERQTFVKHEFDNGRAVTWPSNNLGQDFGVPLPEIISEYGVVSNADRQIMRSISGCRNQFPKEFNHFNKSIWTHLTTNLQNDHTFTWKMRVRSILHNQIRLAFPDSLLLVVGSTVNGCGAYNSDMDLCLGIPCPMEHYITSKGYAAKHLRKVRRILHVLDIVRNVEYIPAKVPILKMNFTKPYSNLEVDINVNNLAGVYNSFLLHNYSRIDDRFPAICLLVKHWAKIKGIGDACGGFLNSYSLILMVLHFLQCGVEPPILPNLQQLYPDLFNLRRNFIDFVFFTDLPTSLPEITPNDRTVGELLIAFFDYYNRFDFNRCAISVRMGKVFPRTELPSNTKRFRLFIEEPFDLQNTARCVTNDDQWIVILDAFGKAAKALLPKSKQAPDLLKIGIRI